MNIKSEKISAVIDLLDATLDKSVQPATADKMVIIAIRLLRSEISQLTGN